MGKLLLLGLGVQEILLIALVILLFFGGRKIPGLMKGIGKGIRNFKDGMNGVDDKEDEKNEITSGQDKK